MPNIPGIEEIKGMRKVSSRSLPPHMCNPYISLYMLNSEKERLEKEKRRLGARMETIVGRLEEIEKDMDKLQSKNGKAQRKGKLGRAKIGEKMERGTNWDKPEKPNVETGWKIKTLKKGRKLL